MIIFLVHERSLVFSVHRYLSHVFYPTDDCGCVLARVVVRQPRPCFPYNGALKFYRIGMHKVAFEFAALNRTSPCVVLPFSVTASTCGLYDASSFLLRMLGQSNNRIFRGFRVPSSFIYNHHQPQAGLVVALGRWADYANEVQAVDKPKGTWHHRR